MIDEQLLYNLSDFFRVFSDPTRLKMIVVLRQGEHSVTEIADKLNMSHSSISHQLGIFRRQRIVKHRREGKMIKYSLDDDHVENLVDMAIDHFNHQ